jgi:hypothetical protein
MEKVWRSFLVWKRRPVIPLNGIPSSCFRKNSRDFVKECKTGNFLPLETANNSAPSYPSGKTI